MAGVLSVGFKMFALRLPTRSSECRLRDGDAARHGHLPCTFVGCVCVPSFRSNTA